MTPEMKKHLEIVKETLDHMSDEVFFKLLDEHKKGEIAEILMDTWVYPSAGMPCFPASDIAWTAVSMTGVTVPDASANKQVAYSAQGSINDPKTQCSSEYKLDVPMEAECQRQIAA
jgi:hypothetical protein